MASKNKRKWFFTFVKSIIKIFKKKPAFVCLGEEPSDGAIYISNHCATSGPIMYELYFPRQFRMWGAHEMLGSLKSRFNYLAKVYYMQKKHWGKFKAYTIGAIFSLFSYFFYKGMKIIGTYSDMRLRNTLRISVDELINNRSIIIYPENSSDGYHDVLKEYYAGFLLLAEQYHKETQKDVLIYGMYYSKKHKKVIIDKPISYLDIVKLGKDKKIIANQFKNRANEIYFKHFSGDGGTSSATSGAEIKA